jgi:general stress protein YciG
MAGTKEGAAKAALTNKEKYGKDFYRKIGSMSWDDPNRSHETGFALLPKEKVVELGRKGGQQNKGKKYVTKKVEYETAESFRALLQADQTSDSTDISE